MFRLNMDFIFLMISVTLLDCGLCFTGMEDFTVTAFVGGNCSLPCNSSGDSEVKILAWLQVERDTELLIYRGGKVVHRHSDRVQVKHSLPLKKDMSMTLSNVTAEDNGTYKCWIYYGDRKEEVKTIYLDIKGEVQSPQSTYPLSDPPGNDTDPPRLYRGMASLASLASLVLVLTSLLIYYLLRKVQCLKSESSRRPSTNTKSLTDPLRELAPYRGGGVCVPEDRESEHVLTLKSSSIISLEEGSWRCTLQTPNSSL